MYKNWWFWEIAAALTSLISTSTILVVLASADGRPLSTWSLKVSLNALIAFLAAIGRLAMVVPVAECVSQAKWIYFQNRPRPLDHLELFDDASRGPLGVFWLLYGLKCQAILLSWGAFIITAFLLYDPFIQQVVAFQVQPLPTESARTVENMNSAQGIYRSGDGASAEIYVHVIWSWLVFPITLVLLALVFLTWIIWMTSKTGTAIWKSSTLPLLFSGLKGWNDVDLGVGNRVDLRGQAKVMTGIMKIADDGLLVFERV
ncbi:hypothetical protein BDY21DRAFT_282662 [Lineolata rhizophorae]|uniref:Uncharacterized protein n=1 Tax=Lineolata rhizophorae TaxID=578093 RepID=A0A6A6P4Z7_9PEZI|nr:hypothetical protein BDY21DRAFT_282662 [Lineolata rhizophorae]